MTRKLLHQRSPPIHEPVGTAADAPHRPSPVEADPFKSRVKLPLERADQQAEYPMDCISGGLFQSCMSGNTVDRRKARKPKTNLNKDGTLKGGPPTQLDIQSDLLRGLFLMIDQNDSGSLQIDELRAVMGNADTFMSVVDTNHDNSITAEEFYRWSKEYIVCHLPGNPIPALFIQCPRYLY
jgi:hypothetical protein